MATKRAYSTFRKRDNVVTAKALSCRCGQWDCFQCTKRTRRVYLDQLQPMVHEFTAKLVFPVEQSDAVRKHFVPGTMYFEVKHIEPNGKVFSNVYVKGPVPTHFGKQDVKVVGFADDKEKIEDFGDALKRDTALLSERGYKKVSTNIPELQLYGKHAKTKKKASQDQEENPTVVPGSPKAWSAHFAKRFGPEGFMPALSDDGRAMVTILPDGRRPIWISLTVPDGYEES